MYIVKDNDSADKYLIYDDGYKWSNLKTLHTVKCNNTPEHPFIFKDRNDAWSILHRLNFRIWTRVVEVDIGEDS